MENVREISTQFYTNKAFEILSSVLGQLSDGIWENSQAAAKYWRNFSVKRRTDGQVYFKVNANSWSNSYGYMRTRQNPFADMSDSDFCKWIAGKLKAVIQCNIRDKGRNTKIEWKRDNDKFVSNYLSFKETVTIADIYTVYDYLLGRKIRNFEIFGKPRDSQTAEKLETLQNQLKDIRTEYTEKFNILEKEYGDKIEALHNELESARNALNKERYQKINAIQADINAIEELEQH